MGGSRKAKRVTWASDVNLCQVRMFLMEESPSEVCISTQDHLQAKSSGSMPHNGAGSYVNLPPGFEGLQHANSWRLKSSQIPHIKWKLPIRFEVTSEWRLVAGEESTEVESQNQRESGVLEAVYPRPSAIPPNPSGLDIMEYSNNTDQFPPVVPLTPIEEEDSSLENSNLDKNVASVHGEADFMTIAQAAVTSIMAGQNQENLVDRELLIKLLSDPKMVKHLSASHARSSTSNTNQQHTAPATQALRIQNLPNLKPPLIAPQTSVSVPPTTGTLNGQPFYSKAPVTNQRHHHPTTEMRLPVRKDINYYKSLIQQHGGERREPMPALHQYTSQEEMNMARARDGKVKVKPCTYFNTPNGCKYGDNCAFHHDGNAPQVTNTKRMKLDREITGL